LRIINIDPNPDLLRSGGRSQNPTRLVGKASFGQHSNRLKNELLGAGLRASPTAASNIIRATANT
jgi:hypothetical protein